MTVTLDHVTRTVDGIPAIRDLHRFGSEGFLPDRTLVLLLEEGGSRAAARDGQAADRIGGRSSDYHRAVEQGFQSIAAEEPERVRLVPATGSPDEVTDRLLA